MSDRSLVVQRSCLAVILTTALLITTGATLFHWHKDWSDQSCQLCHVRDLPTLHNTSSIVHTDPLVSSQEWIPIVSTKELDSWTSNLSTRAPPAPFSFAF